MDANIVALSLDDLSTLLSAKSFGKYLVGRRSQTHAKPFGAMAGIAWEPLPYPFDRGLLVARVGGSLRVGLVMFFCRWVLTPSYDQQLRKP